MKASKDYKELKPIVAPSDYYDEMEKRIQRVFREEIYWPLMKMLEQPKKVLKNSAETDKQALFWALNSGRITFNRGTFSGKFEAATTKAMKALGAKWDNKEKAFKIALKDLPDEWRSAISATESKFQKTLSAIDKKLSEVLPEKISALIKVEDLFDKTIYKIEKEFHANVKKLVVTPTLTEDERKKIAKDWEQNLRLYVKKFADDQVLELRSKVKASVFAGNRYGSLVSTIQKSYGVSANKARFLARQESRLLTAKYQHARYDEAGVKEYTWHHVVGSEQHPVRPRHKALGDASVLKGTVYRFDQPPVTTEPGESERRNNPGQDYNCRCMAKPVVRFK